MAGYDWRPYSMYTFSSAESRWSTPRRCFQRLDYDFVQYGNPVVSPGKIFTTRQGEEGRGNSLADVLVQTKVVELKHKPPRITKPLSMYVGEKSAALFVTDRQGFTCAVNLETGTIDEVTGMSGNYELQTVVPFEIDWPAFFMSRLDAH
ncbi:hypothetical protein ACQJBY_040348 [Aegilops geniculata]